jgi:hypothetical protein
MIPKEIPGWVSGRLTNDGSVRKYHRAIKFLQDENTLLRAQGKPEVEITEATILARYKDYGGKVIETEPEEVIEEPAVEAPKKKRK